MASTDANGSRPPLGVQEQYCRSCAAVMSREALACPRCGAPNPLAMPPAGVSPKSRTAALLLCFFFGVIGVHRFYVGKVGTGIAMILTIGGLGIWAFIDFIMIIVGAFTDKQGLRVELW